jgi:S1-C subfamily serine protease
MIDPEGLILTTSRNLGSAPIANFTTQDGKSGVGWVVGRNDTMDVALLEVQGTSGPFSFVSLSTDQVPANDAELITMQYGATPGSALDRRVARVLGSRPDLNTGIRYVQVQVAPASGAEGGALIDNSAELRGLRMTEAQMIALGLGRAGEVYMMASDALAASLIPSLESGVNIVLPQPTTGGEDPNSGPPPLPAIFRGSVTVNGAPPAANTRIYARVSKAGLPDAWFSYVLQADSPGFYVLAIGVTNGSYTGGSVDFWYQAQKATQTQVYNPGGNTTVNLTF